MLETSQIDTSTRVTRRVRPRTEADRERSRKKSRAKYRARKSLGICAYGYCSEKAEPGHSQCQAHLKLMAEHAREKRIERIAQGLCTLCGKQPQFWGRKCFTCRLQVAKSPLPSGAKRELRRFRDSELDLQGRYAAMELIVGGKLERQRAEALRLYLGIEFGRKRTYREVGRLMNLSGARVNQLLLPTVVDLNERFPGLIHRKDNGQIDRDRNALTQKSSFVPVCRHCRVDPSRIAPNGSYIYKESGLPNVLITGLEFLRCRACRQKAVNLPSPRELNAALVKALISKRGPLTGKETKCLRIAADLTTEIFAKHLGVAKQTVTAWETAPALRFRDDLLVRVIMTSLIGTQPSVEPAKLVEAINARSAGLIELNFRPSQKN